VDRGRCVVGFIHLTVAVSFSIPSWHSGLSSVFLLLPLLIVVPFLQRLIHNKTTPISPPAQKKHYDSPKTTHTYKQHPSPSSATPTTSPLPHFPQPSKKTTNQPANQSILLLRKRVRTTPPPPHRRGRSRHGPPPHRRRRSSTSRGGGGGGGGKRRGRRRGDGSSVH
jgi:hypothetical protein